MKAMVYCPLLFFLHAQAGYSQHPSWLADPGYIQPLYNTGITIGPFQASQGDMASDGSGHHYVAPAGDGSIRHWLLDNRGFVVHTTTFGSNAVRPHITARDGRVHVVLHETNLNRIQLWRSTNGGTGWTNVDFQSVSGILNGLDSFEDERGLHLVYSSNVGIFYHHRDRDLDIWAPYASTVYGSSANNAQPTITTSTVAQGDSAHVLSLYGLQSFKFPTPPR